MTHTFSRTLAAGRDGAVRPPASADRDGDARRPELPFGDDKLRIPQPSFPVLARPRVDALFDRATRHRVTQVFGPAGAGKTVACATWAARSAAAGRVAWLTVDPADQQDWFWAYVCAGVRRARPAPPDILHALEDCDPDSFPLRLVETARAFTSPVTLVLDDIQEATDAAVLNGLDVLIRHAPPTLRLILSARRKPALQLARLRVSGELADIGAADLACTATEADAYFAMLGLDLSPAERDDVMRRTEGWMAGIRLTAMPAGPGGLAGPGALVTEYLWDEVLGRQEPGTRTFLTRTSVVPEVSGGLADAICGQAGGAATLARLSAENCLVGAVDSAAGTYRYHPLLREVLTAELHREFAAEAPVLLGRAARWYAAHGQPLAAVRAAASASDWDQAAEVLAGSAIGILVADGPQPLESVLGLFPDGRAAEDAAVAAAWAGTRLWREDARNAAAYLAMASGSLDRTATATRRVLAPILAALEIMRGAELGQQDPSAPRRGWELAGPARESASTQAEHRAAGLLWFALGCASLGCWDNAAAAEALRHADRQLSAGALDPLRARARAWSALALACCGELAAARRAADDVRHQAIPVTRGASCLAALGAAQVSLARDDLVAAQRLLDEADRDRPGHVPGEPPVAVIAALIRARVLVADGDHAAARAVLSRARGGRTAAWAGPFGVRGGQSAWAGLSRAVTVAEAETALRAGDHGRARALLLRAGDGTGPAAVALALADLLLAEGDFRGARDAAAACLDGGPGRTAAERTRALLAAAVACRRLGEAAQAADRVEEALGLAGPEGAYRVFLDGGAAVRSAVTVLVPPASPHAGFAGRVLERFDSCGPRLGGAGGPVSVPLTDSERAVLRFLPSHMTNEEISAALFLSVNTVKTHLRTAYRKLGVRSRRDAIARCRRLGLL